ncbi:hypothetical protein H4R20_002751 [Coemansia guatemalensis]|uniref:PDEase domain-containing protein n=1 Tax=Coemansia guatemalensis TaxID=2761395 RepID=A0A9W8LUQ6_9FUNG|nr:hypothetical protein H4R20_002751 [Coemansia guatemalensis]
MLRCKRNQLEPEELAVVEKVMDSYLTEQWGSVGLAFDPWDYTRAEKQGIVLAVFKAHNVMSVLELDPNDMLEFTLDMESLYNDVPYHSFNHAVDVVVKLHYMLHDLQAASYLATYDIAALLIGALCHDCGHPGLNNLFQKNANTSLSQKYPDAILERYSIDLAIECINRHRLFRNIEQIRDPVYSDNTVKEIDVASRMLFSIRKAILNTDMSRHFKVVEECKALVSSLAKKARKLSDHEHNSHGERLTRSGANICAEICEPNPKHPKLSVLGPPMPQLRTRSPSDPMASNGQLLSYSMQADDSSLSNTTPSLHGDSWHQRPGTSCDSPHFDRKVDSPSPTSVEKSKIGRLHLRRSTSMSDALLDSTQRQSLINVLLHAVDVFNPVLPWRICKKWSDLMNCESFHQGDLEKKLSLPVSPNMDRDTTDQRQVSLDFGNIIIRPFFSEMVSLFPVDDVLLPALELNMQKWSRLSTDTTHEISSPVGANNYMYSWPVEPVSMATSLSNASSASEGRRLSIAAGTVDIPPARLETIRRHSHEGFKALHRCMVGHMFSKHLEKIQERRRASNVFRSHNPQQNPLRGRQRPAPFASTSGTLPSLQESGADMLSPVTEATCIDDASAPNSGTSAYDASSYQGASEDSSSVAGTMQNPEILISPSHFSQFSQGSGSVPWDPLRVGHARTATQPEFFNQPDLPTGFDHPSSYCVGSLACSPRPYRSTSLDPTLLPNMPSSYPSLANKSGPESISSKVSSDS